MPRTPGSPVPRQVAEVEVELERVVERWRQLPLDRALSYAGRVRALVQSLADRVAEANGVPASAVPDLGPATLMDQLCVMVHDAGAAGAAGAAGVTSVPTATLAEELASLRRELR